MNQFFKIYFKIGLLFIQLVCLPHSNLVRMKDTQKISSLFIQLICLLPLQKSCSVVENLFRNWFFFHPHGQWAHGLFPHFQLSCRVESIEKLVCFSSNWFVYSFPIIMQSIVAFIGILVCFSSNWFVCQFVITYQALQSSIY